MEEPKAAVTEAQAADESSRPPVLETVLVTARETDAPHGNLLNAAVGAGRSPKEGKVNGKLWLSMAGCVLLELLILLRFNPLPVLKLFKLDPAFNIWVATIFFQAGFWSYCLYSITSS